MKIVSFEACLNMLNSKEYLPQYLSAQEQMFEFDNTSQLDYGLKVERTNDEHTTVKLTKSLIPYDNSGRINGGELAKKFQMFSNVAKQSAGKSYEAWNKAWNKTTNKILGKKNVDWTQRYNDGYIWVLRDGTRIFLTNNHKKHADYIVIKHCNETIEKFMLDGTKAELDEISTELVERKPFRRASKAVVKAIKRGQ